MKFRTGIEDKSVFFQVDFRGGWFCLHLGLVGFYRLWRQDYHSPDKEYTGWTCITDLGLVGIGFGYYR